MDHQQYDALSDPTHPVIKDSIPMTDRNDSWNFRPSTELGRAPPGTSGPEYQHLRQISTVSASDIFSEPQQRPGDSLSNDYGYKSYHGAPRKPSRDGSYQRHPAPTEGLI